MIEENAKKLALWIEGTRSAEDIDPEVVEAVYVLRPELAPQPQISSDEIIAQVKAGPFMQTSAPEATEDEEIAFQVMQTLMRLLKARLCANSATTGKRAYVRTGFMFKPAFMMLLLKSWLAMVLVGHALWMVFVFREMSTLLGEEFKPP